MAKLQKSFQDYFRIPILLKPLGNTLYQTVSLMADTLNSVEEFQIQSIQKQFLSKLKINNSQLLSQLQEQITNRPSSQKQKLLFMSQQYQTDWPEFEFIYKCKFIIAIYQPHPEKGLVECLQKLLKPIKQENSKLIGIIFLNDQKNQANQLKQQTKFTILPANLSSEETAVFIQPWLQDVVLIIQQKLISFIFQYRQQQNSVIVFNKNQQKSQPKVMKKKKRYRCVKLCGDIALMLHFYKLAYQTYNQAEQQLRKIDDYIWILGCVQGKLACMTSQFYLPIQNQSFDEKVQQLIQESNNIAKKIKQTNLQIQNNFKILKLFMDQPQKFQQMLQSIMLNIKLTTEQEKFTYFIYIGSLYQKCGMIRKRNYYYYISSLIYLNIKTDISLILLKKIKQSQSLRQWEQLHSKVIKLIIDQEGFFNKFGQFQLELLQQCSRVLSKKDVSITLDNLNFNNYQQVILKQVYSLVQIKQFKIEQSEIKPKLNRIGTLQSPKKSNSNIFMGWKKNQNYLYQQDQLIIFKGTIYNRMTFPVHLKVQMQIDPVQKQQKKFQLVLNPLSSIKFIKEFSFQYCQEPIEIKSLRLKIWNFVNEKQLKPIIKLQTYQKQPNIDLLLPQTLKIQESQNFTLKGVLSFKGKVNFNKIRLTTSIYYDIDVGFQQNQYEIQNMSQIKIIQQNKQNELAFVQSQENQNCYYLTKNNGFAFKLKKLKCLRKHVKKIQISLQYIEKMQSKYQIMKQYSIQTEIINSVWGKLLQLQTIQQPYQKLKHNFKLIEDFYQVKVQFFKNDNNLAPYRIRFFQQDKTHQIVLSDKTSDSINICLPKICYNSQQNVVKQQRQQVELGQLNAAKEIKSNLAQYQKLKPIKVPDLIFLWQNIVSPEINGKIIIQQELKQFMFRPSYKLNIRNYKIKKNEFKIDYDIQTKNDQIMSHRLTVKHIEQNHGQFILKGKMKVQNGSNKNCIKNSVTLKFVENNQQRQQKVVLIIQFENKWKYQKNIILR